MIPENFQRGNRYPDHRYFSEVAKAANLAESANIKLGGSVPPNPIPVVQTVVLVKNMTGQRLPAKSILRTEDAINSGSTDAARRSYVFTEGFIFKGGTPTGTDNDTIIVTQEPADPDQIVRGAVLGVTDCYVDVQNTSDQYASPLAAHDSMTSGETGRFKILNSLTKTGKQHCYIFLGPAASTGGTAPPPETKKEYAIVFPPLYGIIGDSLDYTPLDTSCTLNNFNFTKLGLAYLVGESRSPMPVMEFNGSAVQQKMQAGKPLYYKVPEITSKNSFYQYHEGFCGEWDHCYKTNLTSNVNVAGKLQNFPRRIAFLYRFLSMVGSQQIPAAGLAEVDYSDLLPVTTEANEAIQYPLYLVAAKGPIGGCLPKETIIDAKYLTEKNVSFQLTGLGSGQDTPEVEYKLLIADKKDAGTAVAKIWFEGEVPTADFYLLKVKADFTTLEAVAVNLDNANHIKWWYEGQSYDDTTGDINYYYFRWIRYKMINGVPDLDDTAVCSYDCRKFAAAFARLNEHLLTVFMEQLPSMTYYPLKDQRCWYMINDAECSPHARPRYSQRENRDESREDPNKMWYFDELIEQAWAVFHPCRDVV